MPKVKEIKVTIGPPGFGIVMSHRFERPWSIHTLVAMYSFTREAMDAAQPVIRIPRLGRTND